MRLLRIRGATLGDVNRALVLGQQQPLQQSVRHRDARVQQHPADALRRKGVDLGGSLFRGKFYLLGFEENRRTTNLWGLLKNRHPTLPCKWWSAMRASQAAAPSPALEQAKRANQMRQHHHPSLCPAIKGGLNVFNPQRRCAIFTLFFLSRTHGFSVTFWLP